MRNVTAHITVNLSYILWYKMFGYMLCIFKSTDMYLGFSVHGLLPESHAKLLVYCSVSISEVMTVSNKLGKTVTI